MEYPVNQPNSSDGLLGVSDEKSTSMDLSNGNNPPKKAAFVHKLYAMLSDAKLKDLIWWTDNTEEGTFALQPGAEFANALTGYFKHGNVASFVRQLHMYGFHKVCDQPATNPNGNKHPAWEFIHSSGMFRKGDESSLALIKRRTSSNATKIKSDLNRSLSGTPGIDMTYPPHAPYYYPAPPYAQPPPPQAKYQQPIPYGVTSQGSVPPPQSIVFYPVPQRYNNAVVLPYQHSTTPPYNEQGLPDYQQQQQQQLAHHQHQQSQQLSPQRSHSYPLHHQKVSYLPTPAGASVPQHQHYYYPSHHIVPQPPLQHISVPPPQQQQQQQVVQQQPPNPQQQHHPHHTQQQQHYYQQQYIPQPTSSIQRQTTPTGSSSSRQQTSRISTPHGYAESKLNSYVEGITTTSRELLYGQQMLHMKSEIMNNDLKELSNDTIRATEILPSVKPNLSEGQYADFQTKISNLKGSLSERAQNFEEDEHRSRSHQASIVSNSSQISFYENNSRPRIPSMFVDPLAPVPQHQHQQDIPHPHTHPYPEQQLQLHHLQLPNNRSMSSSSDAWTSSSGGSRTSLRRAPSLANIVSDPGILNTVRRSGSHPELGNPPMSRVSHRPPTSVPNDFYPTSYPSEGGSTTASTMATVAASATAFHEPRSNSLTSNPRTSIPGIGHLQSQIRPSLVEIHRSTSPANVSSSISSGNSNSIFSNKASVSSVSSSVRNSIPQLLNDPIKQESNVAQTSNPNYKNSSISSHPASAATSPKIPVTSSPKPQNYKPQSYTPKQFNRPASSALRTNSTVSPTSVRSASKTVLPPLHTGVKRELNDSDNNLEESKKPKHD